MPIYKDLNENNRNYEEDIDSTVVGTVAVVVIDDGSCRVHYG